MMNILAILLALTVFAIYFVLGPYVSFFIRLLPKMITQGLSDDDRRGIIVRLQAMSR